jgi:hypothetical protein
MGSCVHSALEWSYGQEISPPLQELLVYYQETWEQKDSPDIKVIKRGTTKEDYRRTGVQLLRRFYPRGADWCRKETLGLEVKVNLQLDEGLEYTGYIDRVTRDNRGVLCLIDYKTGKRVPDPGEDRQLRSYALWAMGEYGDEEALLIYEDMRGDRRASATMTESHLSTVRDSLIHDINRVKQATEFPAKPSILCHWCGFNGICPDAQGDGTRNIAPLPKRPSGDAAICPKCSQQLEQRNGRYGTFIGCTGFKNGCRYTRDSW